ncbi:guanine nucleotide-binding protein subunit gamma 1-like isoform X2 [Rhododendron vialii]|nr:guanine nucleotide-binding protein subunit gamma 1-like isoform X2 [Rhododendron vialii]
MEPVTEGGDEDQRPQLSPSLQSGGGESTTVQDAAAAAITVRAAAIPKETASPSFMGKHRMVAAVAQLHQQIQIIQEELEELETLGESSIVCKELVSAVESVPDALLPVTKGPAVVGWDRWFQGAHGSRGRKRWI